MRWPRTSTIARRGGGGRCRTGEAESLLSPAHTLAVPNEHAVSIHDASAEALQAVLLLAQEAARATETSLGARGVNALNASGPGSDQSAPHLHLHVIPRWQGDGLDTWPSTVSNRQIDDDWFDEVRACLVP